MLSTCKDLPTVQDAHNILAQIFVCSIIPGILYFQHLIWPWILDVRERKAQLQELRRVYGAQRLPGRFIRWFRWTLFPQRKTP